MVGGQVTKDFTTAQTAWRQLTAVPIIQFAIAVTMDILVYWRSAWPRSAEAS